jgi:hypothetical protein
LKRHKAHGRIECRIAGNSGVARRTRQRSNALKSAATHGSDELWSDVTSVASPLATVDGRCFGSGARTPTLSGGGASPHRGVPRGGAPLGVRLDRSPLTALRHRLVGGDSRVNGAPRFGLAAAPRSVTWGSASADRSFTGSGLPRASAARRPRNGAGCLLPSGGWHRVSRVGGRCALFGGPPARSLPSGFGREGTHLTALRRGGVQGGGR